MAILVDGVQQGWDSKAAVSRLQGLRKTQPRPRRHEAIYQTSITNIREAPVQIEAHVMTASYVIQ